LLLDLKKHLLPPIWSAEPFATVSDGCAQIRSFWIIASGWRTEPDSQLDG
jgi:hypothetical protein